MGTRKRFDPELYKLNDKKAKDSVVAILAGTEFTVQESEKRTAVDLKLFKNGDHIGYIEVERKTAFKGNTFQYETLNIPKRKEKYCTLDKPTIFMVFNDDFSNYMVMKDKDLLNSPTEVVKNRYCFDGEEFFKVNIAAVSFGNLGNVIDKLTK